MMSPGGESSVEKSEESCTDHYTDQEKDVVRYEFTVVMPTRHVPLLMNRLMRDRNHAVLSYTAHEVPRTTATGYYYSNEPVSLVTFACEAIFLTSWERDLVPPGFLRTCIPGSALRDKDKQRLSMQR